MKIEHIVVGEGGDEEFLVHLKFQPTHPIFAHLPPSTVEATVYAAQSWEKLDGSSSGVSYVSREDGTTLDEASEESRIMFVATCRWRGCWDERSYPKDEEYWDGELALMAKVEEIILPMMRQMIREVNPLPNEAGE